MSSGSSLLYLVKFWAKQLSRASFRQAMPPYPYSNSTPAQTNGTAVCMLSTVPMALYSDALQLCWSTHGLPFLHVTLQTPRQPRHRMEAFQWDTKILQDCSNCGLQWAFCEGDSRAYPWPSTLLKSKMYIVFMIFRCGNGNSEPWGLFKVMN